MSGLLTKSKKMQKKGKLSDPQIGRFLPRGSKGPACVPSLQRTSGRSCLRYPSDPPSLWAPRTAGRKPWKQPKITTFAKSRHHKIYKIINHHLSSSIIMIIIINQSNKQASKQTNNKKQSISQSINQSINQTNKQTIIIVIMMLWQGNRWKTTHRYSNSPYHRTGSGPWEHADRHLLSRSSLPEPAGVLAEFEAEKNPWHLRTERCTWI